MQAARAIPASEIVASADQRVVLHGVPWEQLDTFLALKGDAPVPRITYLEGELEFMSPSRSHESIKKLLARMIEWYAAEKNLPLSGYGSWTLRNAPKERAVEPDECYIIGDASRKDTPDLAVEVIWTSGGIDKLEVYRGLGVGEVWLWQNEVIRIYQLQGERYVEIPHSLVLADLDTRLIAKLAGYEDQAQAITEFRAALRRA